MDQKSVDASVVINEELTKNKKQRRSRTPEEIAADKAAKKVAKAKERDEKYAADVIAENHDKWYRDHIRKTGKLTKDEEVELGKAIKAGQVEGASSDIVKAAKKAADELVNRNLDYVYALAKKHSADCPCLDFEDIVQEGNIGLLTAASKFDYTKGKFSTYAYNWIEKYIKAAIATAYDYNNNVESYEDYTNHGPFASLCDGGCHPDDCVKENPINNIGDGHDYIADFLKEETEEYFMNMLYDGVDSLANLEKIVIMCHFGIRGTEKLTIEQIAKGLNTSRKSVLKLEEQALRKIMNFNPELRDWMYD